MKMRILWILLVLSVVFNLAFIGGAVYHRYFREPFGPPGPPEAEMGPKWKDMMRQNQSVVEPYIEETMEARSRFMEALRDTTVTEDSLRSLLAVSIDKQMQLETKIGQRMIEIRKTIPPERTKRFFKRLHRHMDAGRPRGNEPFPRRP